MRTASLLHRPIIIAIIVAWFCPGVSEARVADPGHPSSRTAASSPAAAASRSGGTPGTPAEAARYAEREQQAVGLERFEGGARISTTTVIIILLVVIILVLLL